MKPKTIALFSQKGGSGKSTIALHLAVAAERAGRRVAVLDLDPQGSAMGWSRTRGTGTPVVAAVPDAELERAIEGAGHDGFDLVLIDAPPHAAPVAARIVKAADLVLVPVRPSPMDIAALPATLQLIANRPAAFVLSACPWRAPEVEEARQLLAQHGRPVLGPITDRRAFFRALTAGQAVIEFEPDGHAAAEIATLYDKVQELL
jgi:chromosome partitioning protein